MKKIFGCLGVFFLSFALISCSSPTPPLTPSQAILSIQQEMIGKHVFPVSQFSQWSPQHKSDFEIEMRNEQCVEGVSDPIIPVIAGPVDLTLTGTFTQTGALAVSGSTTIPSFNVSGSAVRGKTQALNVSVQYTPLSSLPDVEMGIAVTRTGALLAQPGALRDTQGKRLVDERDAYLVYVTDIINRYDPALCALTKHTINDLHPLAGGKYKN